MASSAADALRSVRLERTTHRRYTVTNPRGGTLEIGAGDDDLFTPVELLLAAVAGCTSVDVDILTSRRADPDHFTVEVEAEKLRDENGNHVGPVTVTFDVRFPAGEAGDRARDVLTDAVRASHSRLCTVSRTVMLPTPVRNVVGDLVVE